MLPTIIIYYFDIIARTRPHFSITNNNNNMAWRGTSIGESIDTRTL